jgi:hypothetical protein
MLGMAFDFLPHAPFADLSRYGNTSLLRFPLKRLFNVLLLYQDMHIMHQLSQMLF